MIRTVGGANRVVQVRGEYMPVIDLEGVFEVPRAQGHDGNGIMVIVEAEGGRVAVLVDELLGQQQVVVKNLESNYRKVQQRLGRHHHGRRPRGADPRRRRAGAPVAPLIDVSHAGITARAAGARAALKFGARAAESKASRPAGCRPRRAPHSYGDL